LATEDGIFPLAFEDCMLSFILGALMEVVLCCFRYFMHGACREGDNCVFSHDPSKSKPSMVCKYYKLGCCSYGSRCRYLLSL